LQRAPALTRLTLSLCGDGELAAAAFEATFEAKHITQLREVQLARGHCSASLARIAAVLAHLTKLQHLTIMAPALAEHVYSALGRSLPGLRCLESIQFAETGTADAGAAALAAGVAALCSLTRFELRSGCVTDTCARAAARLCPALPRSRAPHAAESACAGDIEPTRDRAR
jgi:hypothetical protein